MKFSAQRTSRKRRTGEIK